MEFVMVKRETRKLGKDNDGRELTMLGRIYGYTDVAGGIAVLQVEGEKPPRFLEVDVSTRAYKELSGESCKELLGLWEDAEAAALLNGNPSGPVQ